ncbi:hypothetical protein Lbir_2278 [Legionella birminghamensis]|uniref:Capsule biosynthesis protein n=1 Tax=Legionella birminghamensis TaxID=28083 RepID=A0A378I508_9GAMM|nr:hypothetical protein Lbir_2278 [Legionella birminghamensis]STX30269.1 Uncharacterised protein [Legionella birminghamensis]
MSKHLKEIDESYTEHFLFAQCLGFKLIFAGFACLIHAIIPDLFVNTGSKTIDTLSQRIKKRKEKNVSC